MPETIIKSSPCLFSSFFPSFLGGLHRFLSLPLALPIKSSAVFSGKGRNLSVPWRMETSQGWRSSLSMFYSALGTCCSWYHSRIYTFPSNLSNHTKQNMDELPNSVGPSDLQHLVRQLCTNNYCQLAVMYSTFPPSLSTSPWMQSWEWRKATRQHKKPKSRTNTQAHL